MKQIDYEQTGTSWLTTFSLGLLVLLTEIPLIQRSFGGYFIMLPAVVIFSLSRYDGIIRIEYSKRFYFLSISFFFVMAFFYRLMGISTSGYGKEVRIFLYFVFSISIDSINYMSKRQKRFLLIVLLVSLLYTMFSNLQMLSSMGNRYYNLNRQLEEEWGNLMSTQHSTAVMLMSGILLICILNDKEKNRRLLWILLFSICTVFNVMIAQRMTNNILSIIMYIYIIILRKQNKIYIYMIMTVVVVLFAIVLLNYESVINQIIGSIDSQRSSQRLNQIYNYLSTGEIQDAGGSLSARFMLTMRSVNSWLSSILSFFFGVGDHVNNQLIGHHSQFIDVFGQYGLIGAFTFLFSVSKSISLLFEKVSIASGTPIRRQFTVIICVFILRGILGGVVNEQAAASLFVFFPLLLSYILEQEDMI